MSSWAKALTAKHLEPNCYFYWRDKNIYGYDRYLDKEETKENKRCTKKQNKLRSKRKNKTDADKRQAH